jgi:hypothetical protein
MRTKFERDELTDITVRYGSDGKHSKRAHRLVLCAASKFFDNMLSKHDFRENQEGVVTLAIEDKDAAEVVLSCIYGAGYNDQNHSRHALYFNIMVYAAADYCALPDLSRLAAKKFEDAAAPLFGSPNGCNLFIAAAKKAYEETPPHDKVLRPLIAKLCVLNKDKLFSYPGFKSALQENAELSTDITFEFATLNAEPSLRHRRHRNTPGGQGDW